MTTPRSLAVPAVATMISIVLLVLSHLTRDLVGTGVRAVLEPVISDQYTVWVVAGTSARFLPQLTTAATFLSGTALLLTSQRRTAMIPVVLVAAIVPGLLVLSTAASQYSIALADQIEDFRTWQLLVFAVEGLGILLLGLASIAAVIAVWVRGAAGATHAPRTARALPLVVVISTSLLLVIQVLLAVSVMVLDTPDQGSLRSDGALVAIRYLALALPSTVASAVLLVALALHVALTSPPGRSSAWIAAITGALTSVLSVLVSFPVALLFSGDGGGLTPLAPVASAVPVLLLATAIIVVFTLRSASRSRAVSPLPDHLPR